MFTAPGMEPVRNQSSVRLSITMASGSCSMSSSSSSPMVVTPGAGVIGWMQNGGQAREVCAHSPSSSLAWSWMRLMVADPFAVSIVTEGMSGVMLTSSARSGVLSSAPATMDLMSMMCPPL